MAYTKFNRDLLLLKKLSERYSKVTIKDKISNSERSQNINATGREVINKTADRVRSAIHNQKSVVMAFGAHTIKNLMGPVLIQLIKEGWVTHLATNGAGIIHDWELAFQGRTSEDVRENVNKGQFGIWEETGRYINLAIIVGAYEGLGYGESVGKMISREGLDIPEIAALSDETRAQIENDPERAAAAADLLGIIKKFRLEPGFLKISHPYKEFSVQAWAYDLKVPFTGHPMIGHDIIYNHPMNLGSAIGRTALNDFLSFTDSISNIANGVYISLGSAVMSPMIFEIALSMVQNIEIQHNRHIDNHFIMVVDLARSDWDWQKSGEPPADNPAYYLRYCKTFSRMGGEMHYLTADTRDFLKELSFNLSV